MEFRNWDDFAREMQRRANQLRPAFREGTTQATDILHAESKRLMNEEIYGKPEDTGGFSYRRRKGYVKGKAYKAKSGKRVKPTMRGFVMKKSGGRARSGKGRKKWTRTGNLRGSERRRIVSDFEGIVENDANYALPRHDLGLSAGHPESIRGSKRKSDRVAPWRRRAIKNTVEQRRQAYRYALWRALTR